MLRLRSALFLAVFYLNTAVFLILGSPLLLGPRRIAMAALRVHGLTSVWWLKVICGTRMEVRGLHHLLPGPAIIAAKHQAAWDTFAIVPLFRDPAMVMKIELMSLPVYGWFARKFGMIPVRRETGPNALRALLKVARTRVSENREIVIFPEGTRRPPGAPPAYKPGIMMLYDALKVPCCPVALNSGVFWPRHSYLRYPGTIVVEFLEPLPPGLPRDVFMQTLQTRIEEASNRLCREAMAGFSGVPEDLRPAVPPASGGAEGGRRPEAIP